MRSPPNDAPTEGHFYRPAVLATLEETAAVFQIDALSFRCACDRAAYVCGTIAAVGLPDGVMGFRIHGVWRFRFPVAGSARERSDVVHATSTRGIS